MWESACNEAAILLLQKPVRPNKFALAKLTYSPAGGVGWTHLYDGSVKADFSSSSSQLSIIHSRDRNWGPGWDLEVGRKVCDMLVSFDSSGDRPVSLSRCGNASTGLQFALSEPSPGLRNSCPQHAFTTDLHLCFLTPSEWSGVSHQAGVGGLGHGLISAFHGMGEGLLGSLLL